jgi:hypothetical protein
MAIAKAFFTVQSAGGWVCCLHLFYVAWWPNAMTMV